MILQLTKAVAENISMTSKTITLDSAIGDKIKTFYAINKFIENIILLLYHN